MNAPANLLVLGDLHLGSPLRAPIDFKARRRVLRMDRTLSRFLDHHAAHRAPNGAPWTLVLNGDIIDFLHMDLRPDGLNAEEMAFGLTFNQRHARFKLAAIAAYHRKSFKAFARFVEAGHALVFIAGNHDVDLFFKAVRGDLVAHIATHAQDRAAVATRISIEPWFFLAPARAYIEHGHRFDPYSTFPDPLSPLTGTDHKLLAPAFGHWGLRFFCNRVPDFPIHDVDTWGPMDALRWMRAHVGWPLARTGIRFGLFVTQYARDVVVEGLIRRQNPSARRQRRRRRLRRFSRASGLPMRRIIALDAMRQPHVGESMTRLAQALYLDRMALGMSVMLTLMLALLLFDGLGWQVIVCLAAFVASVPVWRWLARRRPPSDMQPILDGVARRLGKLAGAPIVVMGHTHHRVFRRLGRIRWLNPGSWEHLVQQAPHGADVPCDCDTHFIMITGQGDALRTHMMRFCRHTRRPALVQAQCAPLRRVLPRLPRVLTGAPRRVSPARSKE